MTFSINIDTAAWHAHTQSVRDELHAQDIALIPVIKSNGYGLGQQLLAAEAARLGVHAVAVGTVYEVAEVAATFPGDIIVLEPIEPRDGAAAAAWAGIDEQAFGARCIRTVASPEGLDLVLDAHTHKRVVIEGLTSMRRFGFEGPALAGTWQFAQEAQGDGRLRVHGVTIHLPVTPSNEDLDEALQLADEVAAVANTQVHLLLSHVDVRQIEILRRHNPALHFSVRVGTRLWLGRREALQARANVLSVRPVKRGDQVGYHRNRARLDGHVVVVSGGTAHGIGLAAPQVSGGLRGRLIAAASGVLAALGYARSPFAVRGRKLAFAETPHQQVSMLWWPRSVPAPAVGDELEVTVRFTTTRADVVNAR